MLNRYDQLWYSIQRPGRLRSAIGLSAVIHIGLAAAAVYFGVHKELPVTPMEVYAVELSPEMVQAPEPASEPEPEIVPDPEPKPEPPPPPPEPEPEPEPQPEPEPKKPEPKPEPKPVPKPEPKPEPPKEEPKPEPKPEPPKEQPKPEPPKEVPKPEPKPEPKSEPPKEPAPEPARPTKPEVRMKQALPGPLSAWGRLVQKKVEKSWLLPGGVRIDPNENEAVISFWVSKNGQVIGAPEIVKHAADPAVGRSAIEAIKQAAPFPPLPDNYADTEAHVIYTFVPAG